MPALCAANVSSCPWQSLQGSNFEHLKLGACELLSFRLPHAWGKPWQMGNTRIPASKVEEGFFMSAELDAGL